MAHTRLFQTAAITVAAGVTLGAFTAPAMAGDVVSQGTHITQGPETPLNTESLPIVTTNREGPVKPNILNPRPVCNARDEYRTVIYEVRPKYEAVGTLMFTNNNDFPADISQTIGRTATKEFNVTGDFGGEFTPAKALLHFDVHSSETWNQSQTLTQSVEGNTTSYLSYGFNTVSFKGTQQRCKLNGTWGNPWPLSGSAPTALAVRTVQTTDAGSALPTITDSDGSNLGQPLPVPEPPEISAETADPDQHVSIGYRVSSLKAEGFTGVVDVLVNNDTEKRYYNYEQPAMFLVQVKTVEGPEGVDRLLRFKPRSGATVIDYGFNEETSTRSFLVSLSNPVYANSTANLGTLWFGDGLTREGRLVNSIVTTLLNPNGNIAEDETQVEPDWTADNTRVDSAAGATLDDFGNPNPGRF